MKKYLAMVAITVSLLMTAYGCSTDTGFVIAPESKQVYEKSNPSTEAQTIARNEKRSPRTRQGTLRSVKDVGNHQEFTMTDGFGFFEWATRISPIVLDGSMIGASIEVTEEYVFKGPEGSESDPEFYTWTLVDLSIIELPTYPDTRISRFKLISVSKPVNHYAGSTIQGKMLTLSLVPEEGGSVKTMNIYSQFCASGSFSTADSLINSLVDIVETYAKPISDKSYDDQPWRWAVTDVWYIPS